MPQLQNSNCDFVDVFKITNWTPYNCRICSKKSVFKQEKKVINIITAMGGLGGVILFYSVKNFGWETALITMSALRVCAVIVFFKYAELEVLDESK